MKFLLGTHALLWWLADDHNLGSGPRDLIEDPANDVLVSLVSLWEIAVKVRVGKLHADVREILEAVQRESFTLLHISTAHLLKLSELPMHHHDPFDHLLIAQAIEEDATFISSDRHIVQYAVKQIACR